MKVELHSFVTSSRVGGEWLAVRDRRLLSAEVPLGMHWIGGWVGLRADVDAVVRWRSVLP